VGQSKPTNHPTLGISGEYSPEGYAVRLVGEVERLSWILQLLLMPDSSNRLDSVA